MLRNRIINLEQRIIDDQPKVSDEKPDPQADFKDEKKGNNDAEAIEKVVDHLFDKIITEKIHDTLTESE